MRSLNFSSLKQVRPIYWVITAFVVVLLLILTLAPSNNWQRSGSSYSRTPDGYAAWYGYMEQQGVTLSRTRDSLEFLIAQQKDVNSAQPRTLLQVQPRLTSMSRLYSRRRRGSTRLTSEQSQWLDAGNNLIVLGVRQPVRDVSFSSGLTSDFGRVLVETQRRAFPELGKPLLEDQAGAVVWEVVPKASNKQDDAVQTIANSATKRGHLILATTPYLAANAYQDEVGNYKFLADLVTQGQHPILVDEYIHGYRPKPTPGKAHRRRATPAQSNSVLNYLAQTPLLPVVVQILVLLLIAFWAKNRRFGRFQSIAPPPVNNSMAYIQALAGALRQANSKSFVVNTINQAEVRRMQRQLGFGDSNMDLSDLIQLLQSQQQQSDELQALQRLQARQNLSDRELLQWLEKLQQMRQRSDAGVN